MDGITYTFGGLDPSGSFSENLRLPILRDLGAITLARQAFDTVAATRKGIVLQGIKGSGKSLAIREAASWFSQTEKKKRKADNAYRIRTVAVLETIRDANYRETGVQVATALAGYYRDRVHNRKKDANEVRADVVQILLTQRVALLSVDEGERCSDATLRFLRDLMADTQAADSNAYAEEGWAGAGGVGIVLVGTESIGKRVAKTNEAGQRWTNIIQVPPLSLDDSVRVYAEWLPGLRDHAKSIGAKEWKNYIGSLICRGTPISFRIIENHVRGYVHLYTRMHDGITEREQIAFDRPLFEMAAQGGFK